MAFGGVDIVGTYLVFYIGAQQFACLHFSSLFVKKNVNILLFLYLQNILLTVTKLMYLTDT